MTAVKIRNILGGIIGWRLMKCMSILENLVFTKNLGVLASVGFNTE